MSKKTLFAAAGVLAMASPLAAQETQGPPDPDAAFEGSVFDGDYLSIGVGVAYSPSYDGSDDYVFNALPIVQGSLGGIDIDPRPGGLALDFIPEKEGDLDFSLGISARIVRNRADQIEDPVVELLGELDTAIEVGPTAGVGVSGLLNPFDSLTFSTDVRWDVAGAHDGMVVAPWLTYFTPLSRGIAASLTLSTTHVDGSYADFYHSVTPEASAITGLPVFDADSGFKDVGATVFAAFDLDGDVTNGGLAIATIAGYSRLLGDFKDTPFTSIRGDADQFFVAVGLGYTF